MRQEVEEGYSTFLPYFSDFVFCLKRMLVSVW